MQKEILRKLLKMSSIDNPPLSKDWGEGEDIEIEGVDRQLRMKMDNFLGGKRWHPSKNKYIKMKLRQGAKEQ